MPPRNGGACAACVVRPALRLLPSSPPRRCAPPVPVTLPVDTADPPDRRAVAVAAEPPAQMKPCGACGQSLARESFSKNQWRTKKHRRCRNCIANDRRAVSEAELDLAPLSPGECAGNDAAPELGSSDLLMPARSDGCKVEGWTDEDLFREPPPREDCPICFIRMPLKETEIMYQSCCGKIICAGCVYAFRRQQSPGKRNCPYCRTPDLRTEREANERLMKRAKDSDPEAMCNLGYYYSHGSRGLPRDHGKAMELWLRAGELGSAASYCFIGEAYREGNGVEANMDKARYHYALAAMGGSVPGRFNFGLIELEKGDVDRAVKHFMILAGCGDDGSLAAIRKLFARGLMSKADFENALRAYGEDRAETKSDQRETAAADPDFAQPVRS